jgi:hypothetical protein
MGNNAVSVNTYYQATQDLTVRGSDWLVALHLTPHKTNHQVMGMLRCHAYFSHRRHRVVSDTP